MRKYSYDYLGDVALLKFPENTSAKIKKKEGDKFLKEHPYIRTVLEKAEKIKGRLRIAKIKLVSGVKNFEVIYPENGCKFFFDIRDTYFSPRMANHRNEISDELVKKITKNKNKVLVMFAGVAPWPIVLAKKLKMAGKKAEIVSSEINRKASKYAEKNVFMNKVQEYVKVVQGDSRNVYKKLPKTKFDFIFMARPNLKDSFLKDALKMAKKGTLIYYHGFGTEEKVLSEIKKEIGNKIGKISVMKAGEIAPYKFRWLAQFVVR